MMEPPSSGMKSPTDCTRTGGFEPGSGGDPGGGGGDPGGVPPGGARTAGGGSVGSTTADGINGTDGGPTGARCGEDRTCPVRRSFHVICTANVVSPSRISLSCVRLRIFLLNPM